MASRRRWWYLGYIISSMRILSHKHALFQLSYTVKEPIFKVHLLSSGLLLVAGIRRMMHFTISSWTLVNIAGWNSSWYSLIWGWVAHRVCLNLISSCLKRTSGCSDLSQVTAPADCSVPILAKWNRLRSIVCISLLDPTHRDYAWRNGSFVFSSLYSIASFSISFLLLPSSVVPFHFLFFILYFSLSLPHPSFFNFYFSVSFSFLSSSSAIYCFSSFSLLPVFLPWLEQLHARSERNM